MTFLRSLFFWLLLYISVIILLILYFPLAIFIKGEDFADYCARKWSQTLIWLLKIICGVSYEIIDAHNIPKETCIIACKHQSMWETVIFHAICKNPSYIYKKELLKVPFYGWYIARMSSIKVDRQGGASALKSMIKQSKENIENHHNIIIFPQGTRTPIGASTSQYPYQVGVAAIYMSCQVKVAVATLNSGEFWGKGMLIRKKGCIKIKFVEAIEPGLSKAEFMKILEDKIENTSL